MLPLEGGTCNWSRGSSVSLALLLCTPRGYGLTSLTPSLSLLDQNVRQFQNVCLDLAPEGTHNARRVHEIERAWGTQTQPEPEPADGAVAGPETWNC